MPLVTFGAITACIIAVFTLASGAIIQIPTCSGRSASSRTSTRHVPADLVGLRSLVAADQRRRAGGRLVRARRVVFGAKPLYEKVSRTAFLLYILSSAGLRAPPPGGSGLGPAWKIFNTSYAMYLAVLASMIHGLTVPGAIEVAQREKGYTKGLFEWLRKAPWGNPVFSGMFISLVGFGFLGGITGVTIGTEQINMIIHNTMYVPGHFHATVVIGTTLAFMAHHVLPAAHRCSTGR